MKCSFCALFLVSSATVLHNFTRFKACLVGFTCFFEDKLLLTQLDSRSCWAYNCYQPGCIKTCFVSSLYRGSQLNQAFSNRQFSCRIRPFFWCTSGRLFFKPYQDYKIKKRNGKRNEFWHCIRDEVKWRHSESENSLFANRHSVK